MAQTTPGLKENNVACGEHDHSRISDFGCSDMDATFSVFSIMLKGFKHQLDIVNYNKEFVGWILLYQLIEYECSIIFSLQ